MDNSPPNTVDRDRRREFEHNLGELIERFGGSRDEAFELHLTRCVEQIADALAASASDGSSLSPLDVVRIRAGKFAATRVPAQVFRNPGELARLRREIHLLALAFVGETGAEGSRFPHPQG